MASPAELARQFRAALLQQDAAALQRISAAYADVLQSILTELSKLLEQRSIAAAAGQATGIGWLYREQRLTTLLDQVAAQMDAFAQALGPQVAAAQLAATQNAQQQAADLIRASLGTPPAGASITLSLGELQTAAVETIVGSLQPQGPLAGLLDGFGAQASAAAKRALVTGVATGQGPASISRQITQALDVSRWRALTISRTETVRAYRDSSLATYAANRDVVNGWRWRASLSSRTCGFCISMSGSFHQLDEPFASHPRCRCTAVPETKTWAELGVSDVPDTQLQMQSGSDWFAQQDDATQLAILGPSKYRAFSAGAITLDDLRGFATDPVWGAIGYERSLTSILGADAQQFLKPS